MRKTRLFWQIFPVSITITFITLLLVSWFATSFGRIQFLEHTAKGVAARAQLIEPTIARLTGGPHDQLQNFVRKVGRKAATRITVVDSSGVVVVDSDEDHEKMDNHATRPELKLALSGEQGSSLRFSRTLGKTMLYYAIPLEIQPNGIKGALRLAVPADSLEGALSAFHLKVFWAGVVVLLFAALLSLYSARRISKPLEDMKRGAEKLTSGRIDQLVKIESENMSVEMAGLAGSINSMAEQINKRIRIIMQQRNELEALFSSMGEAVVALDGDKRVIRMNRAAATLYNIDANAVKKKSVHGVIRNSDILDLIDKALSSNEIQEEEVTFFDGTEPKTLHTHAVPLREEGESNMGVLVVMNDLTILNKLENIRQDFVANVSHELKTPITAIKGYVETILDGAIDDRADALRFLAIVSKQANRLDAIVDDLLTLSRIENKADKDEILLTVEPVCPALEAAKQTCSVQAEEKNINIEIECEATLAAPINQPLLEQAMINLLTNAISYSPEGAEIVMRGYSTNSMQGVLQVRLSVADTGPGIGREHLPRLFERFYRCDPGRSRDQGGTGLGLAIVKHIAQSHNGRVEVESKIGSGSTFTITLPAALRKR